MMHPKMQALHHLMGEMDKDEGEELKKHSPKLVAIKVTKHETDGDEDMHPDMLHKLLHGADEDDDIPVPSPEDKNPSGDSEDDEKLKALAKKR